MANKTIHAQTLKAQPVGADEIVLASFADAWDMHRATITSLLTSATLTDCTLTNPTLTTPTLGVASATTINKVTLTAPATGSTLTIADGKTLTVSNSITLAGTDGNTLTVPSGGGTAVITSATQTLTNKTITSPTITGTATCASINASTKIRLTAVDTSGGLGFSTGAGGAYTQVTSKSTTVSGIITNGWSGSITMHNANLAADTVVSFTFSHSGIDAGDVMILNHISGGTVGAYHLNAQCAADAATINVTNISTGTLGEAVVIQYVIIKAVTA